MTTSSEMELDEMTGFSGREDWDDYELEDEGRGSFSRFVPNFNLRRAGIVVTLAVWLGVGYNALFLQPGPHPAPFFGSRATARTEAVPPAAARRTPPGDRAQVLDAPAASPAVASAPVAGGDAEMVRYLQEALVQRGYDVGGVDGAMGPRTRAAIVAFQADLGLEQTGIADEALLARLSIDTIPAPRTQPVQVSPATAPAPAPRAAVKAPSEMDRALSMAGDSSGQGRLVRTQPCA